MNQNLQEIIKINVGGHIKSTLKSTLTYINDSKFNEVNLTFNFVVQNSSTFSTYYFWFG